LYRRGEEFVGPLGVEKGVIVLGVLLLVASVAVVVVRRFLL
jgi:hypothetical protein